MRRLLAVSLSVEKNEGEKSVYDGGSIQNGGNIFVVKFAIDLALRWAIKWGKIKRIVL